MNFENKKMKPTKIVCSASKTDLLISVVGCIEEINCDAYFSNHLPIDQVMIKSFQHLLCKKLASTLPNVNWSLEFVPENRNTRDRIDVFGESSRTVVIIELDKWRADQVAKKFVSRAAMFSDRKFLYISICFPGTDFMNRQECVKYFDFCKTLSEKMGNNYAGFIVE